MNKFADYVRDQADVENDHTIEEYCWLLDEAVDAWHEDTLGLELPDYLGLTAEEYEVFLSSPRTLIYHLLATSDE